MSDQDKISPYSINTISSRRLVRGGGLSSRVRLFEEDHRCTLSSFPPSILASIQPFFFFYIFLQSTKSDEEALDLIPYVLPFYKTKS